MSMGTVLLLMLAFGSIFMEDISNSVGEDKEVGGTKLISFPPQIGAIEALAHTRLRGKKLRLKGRKFATIKIINSYKLILGYLLLLVGSQSYSF